MPKHLRAIVLASAILAVLVPASILAMPSAKFYQEDGEVFDDWDICRTNAAGEDGFFQVSATGFYPIIVGESLGQNADQAYRIGQQFAGDYPDMHQRAEEIFAFVRDRVRYTSDESQFSFAEFAQNADELVVTIEDEGVAHGDCEDYAVLLAVMYKGAGFRGTELEGYEVDDEAITKGEPPDKPSTVITPDGGSSGIHISPFFIVVVLLLLISLIRRRR